MPKFATVAVLLFLSIHVKAQQTSVEKEIQQTIVTFFEGLHNGDSTLIKTTMHRDIKLQTTFTNKAGEKVLKTEAKAQLLKAIASKKPTDVYLEKLGSYTIKVDGNLASVWTPYEFYVNGTFSHCGANSFQLFNNNGNWEIIYLVDMRRRQNCTALKGEK